MKDYKYYLLRQLGLKESQFKKSTVERDAFPGIDPKEQLSEDDTHGVSRERAMQRGLSDNMMVSPTAIPIPIIGVAVRGSSTGGLPSGADQTLTDITPSKVGGYEKVEPEDLNTKLVDRTPTNPELNSPTPINPSPSTSDAVTHPHQVQRDAGEAPQAVTGASTDSDDTLTLKSAVPKGIDVDVTEKFDEEEEGKQEPKSSTGQGNPNKEVGMGVGMNETFEKHKKLLKEKLKELEECEECGCDHKKADETGEPMDESHSLPTVKKGVGASQPFVTKWKMDKEKAGMVKTGDTKGKGSINEAFHRVGVLAGLVPVKEKTQEVTPVVEYTQPFARMRGLANLGERRMMPDGTWITETKEEKPEDLSNKCVECGKELPANYDSDTCPKCKAKLRPDRLSQFTESEDKWMQDVSKGAEQKGTKGALHKDLGVPEDKKIPDERLESLKAMLHKKSERGTLSDKELKLSRRVNAALNMRKANKQ